MSGEADISSQPANDNHFRWWLLPSWLGLDATCVDLTWTWAVSQSTRAKLSFRPAAAMFFTVWSIYLLDRLIDVARCDDWRQATGRLCFGRRHRALFLGCLLICGAGILSLLFAGIPTDVIRRGAFVAAGLALHFLVFIVPAVFREKLYGKEFSVGLVVALGVYACLGYTAGMAPLLASIALVVAYNCLIIAAKDAASDEANDPGGASRWWRTMNRDLLWCGMAMTVTFGLGAILGSAPAFYISIATSFLCLTALHRRSQQFSGDAVRALADFALFTPVLSAAFLTAYRATG